jgi:methionine-S-sulfoxide reductase
MTSRSALVLFCVLLGSSAFPSAGRGQGSDRPQQKPVIAAEQATLAGGCFWCLEEALEKIPGIVSAISGYTGGSLKNPTYEQVSSGRTGHTEAVRITFDPSRVTYAHILEVFWRNIDPVDASGQFCDRGSQYRAGIFVHDETQRRTAEASRQAMAASGRFKHPIATEIVAAGPFYVAEDYHQDYYKKNPFQYRFYKFSCGRERRLEQIWGPQGSKVPRL